MAGERFVLQTDGSIIEDNLYGGEVPVTTDGNTNDVLTRKAVGIGWVTPAAVGYQGVYASGTTYALSAIVKGSDSNLYLSVVAANHGNPPVGDNGTHWLPFVAVFAS